MILRHQAIQAFTAEHRLGIIRKRRTQNALRQGFDAECHPPAYVIRPRPSSTRVRGQNQHRIVLAKGCLRIADELLTIQVRN
jgi:hypothetical protein